MLTAILSRFNDKRDKSRVNSSRRAVKQREGVKEIHTRFAGRLQITTGDIGNEISTLSEETKSVGRHFIVASLVVKPTPGSLLWIGATRHVSTYHSRETWMEIAGKLPVSWRHVQWIRIGVTAETIDNNYNKLPSAWCIYLSTNNARSCALLCIFINIHRAHSRRANLLVQWETLH